MADEQPPKKKSTLKRLLFIPLLLFIGGGAVGAWFFFLQDKFMAMKGGDQKTEKVAVNADAARPRRAMAALPVFTVNLAGSPPGQRFIMIYLDVGVTDAKVADEIVQQITQQDARIHDAIILLLSSKSYADIANTESKRILKSEITDRLNNILGPGKIHQVFITAF